MKEKRTYKRFDLLAFLAILGCIGMLLFECIFIFELYDRAPSQVAILLPAQPAAEPVPPVVQPAVSVSNPPSVEKSAPVPAATNAAPASSDPTRPVQPAEPEAAPAAVVPAG